MQTQLGTATKLLKYYNEVVRTITPGNIQWDMVMNKFVIQWKALEDRKKAKYPDVPKITKALPFIEWTESLRYYLHQKIGVMTINFVYGIRIDGNVPAIGPIATVTPHSQDNGSI